MAIRTISCNYVVNNNVILYSTVIKFQFPLPGRDFPNTNLIGHDHHCSTGGKPSVETPEQSKKDFPTKNLKNFPQDNFL